MELYIYNSNRELAGIVESFEYLRWTRRYSQCGSFELKAIATPEDTELLKEGKMMMRKRGSSSIWNFLKLSMKLLLQVVALQLPSFPAALYGKRRNSLVTFLYV